MFVYDNIFKNDDDIRTFIHDAETHYKKQVLDIADDVAKHDNIRFLTLAGPTCSGKTTSSYILEQEFEKRGISTKIISIGCGKMPIPIRDFGKRAVRTVCALPMSTWRAPSTTCSITSTLTCPCAIPTR